jgi:hypothetical protein
VAAELFEHRARTIFDGEEERVLLADTWERLRGSALHGNVPHGATAG